MFKQIILPLLIVIVFIVGVGIFVQKSAIMSTPSEKTITIGSIKINVQVADTEALRVKGLSGTASLNSNSGMLFVFASKGVSPIFWMKGMLVPLDMIWILNGKIVRIDKNLPIPASGTADNNLNIYSPGQPIDYVLEVNAGFSDKNNIKVGDSVNLSAI